MNIIHDLKELKSPMSGAVVTIGNFDGVHLGHREIFRRLIARSREMQAPSVVCTFVPHPLKLLRPDEAPALISTYEERERLIRASSIDTLICLPFTLALASYSPERFIDEILIGKIGMTHLMVGYDYAFGKNRSGNVGFLKRASRDRHFTFEIFDPFSDGKEIYSSTRVRQLLSDGDVEKVVNVLGRQFNLEGKVVKGAGRGRSLGFPTANLVTEKEILPKMGVYAVKIKVDDRIHDGVANIGFNPTFDGKRLSLEVHLFDLKEDLYEKSLRVYFVCRIRDEQRFDSPQRLISQIHRDVEEAKAILRQRTLIEYRDYLSQGEQTDVACSC